MVEDDAPFPTAPLPALDEVGPEVGINDHLPRVPEDGSTRAASLVRQRQSAEAWRYPIMRRQVIGERDATRPAGCPQCFGEVQRCPLHTRDQRLCPHRF